MHYWSKSQINFDKILTTKTLVYIKLLANNPELGYSINLLVSTGKGHLSTVSLYLSGQQVLNPFYYFCTPTFKEKT